MLGEIDLKLSRLVRDDLRQSQSCFCLEPTKEGKRIAEQGACVRANGTNDVSAQSG